MEFVETIRKRLKIKSQAQFAVKLRKYPQAYQSLVKATDRITLRDLIALRRVSGLSDRELLDVIEKELESSNPEAYRELPPKDRE
ncbi:MAG: hypothetical protein J5J00_15365 [Deltaproteobacteria bacterium]|nr:hypothetical protein [Deltaproteobacteria bacterium]